MSIDLDKVWLSTVAALFMSVAPVLAGDWSINAIVSENASLNDNSTLNVVSPGYVFNTAESLNTDFIYTMPDGKFDVVANIVRRDYFGPGKGTAQDVFLPNLEAHFSKFGPRSSLNVSANYAILQVPFFDASLYDTCTPILGTALVDCDGVITDPVPIPANGNKQSFGTQTAYSYTIDPRDSLSWSNSVNFGVFSPNAGSNVETFNSNLSFNRKLTKRTDGSISFGFSALNIENAANLDRFSYNLKGNISTHLNNRLTMTTSASVSLADVYQDDLLLIGTPRITQSNWSGNLQLGLDSLLNESSTLSINEILATTEQANHSFLNRSTTSLSLSHRITEVSSVKLASSVNFAEVANALSGKDIAFSFNISPSYSVQLAPNWTMAAAYKFSLRDSAVGSATSNSLNLTFNHNFVLLP
jgi:hypothetical protein